MGEARVTLTTTLPALTMAVIHLMARKVVKWDRTHLVAETWGSNRGCKSRTTCIPSFSFYTRVSPKAKSARPLDA